MKIWLVISLAALGSLASAYSAPGQTGGPQAAEKHVLRGHTPAAAARTRPLGRLPGTNSLRLAISLPLRHPEALASLLQRLYDPASPDYRHYLTPAQFTEQFGPTAQDYQAIIHFAKANGLAVDSTHDSRRLLDVRGKVSDIENAFHVTLQSYQHPTEARRFYAPDAEPWVDASLPILNVAGLSDYALLRRALHNTPMDADSGGAGGSGPGGGYIGQDFRNAYAPGVSLKGTGQMVGLFEADGYYGSDITNYEGWANPPLPDVPVQNVFIDNFSGTPGAGNSEVALDIEMAISMAPGLSSVVVFECTNTLTGTNAGTEVQYWLDTLDTMASSNQIKQFSSSWGYTGGADPNTAFDATFQQMAAQGQSFFQASGDGDAWYAPIWTPADSPYVTSVGGTALTMTSSGATYTSEQVWNSGTNVDNVLGNWFAGGNGSWGSGGGVSTVYPIPSWQTNLSMVANLGSTSMRNIPDVALAATNVFAVYGNGTLGNFIGTSCSAPLWAGFAALINQQAANGAKASVGFLNPAIYALGQGPNYGLCFHDITTGSNTSSGSPGNFFAVQGYDLCTGWGTPASSNLINALARVAQPTITNQPASQTNAAGTSASFHVGATATAPLFYQWQFNGANTTGATQTNIFLTGLTQANAGNYAVVVSNQWGSLTSSVAVLTVSQATPVVTWASPASITYGAALTSSQLNATATVPGAFAYTPASGTILSAGAQSLSVIFTPTDTADYKNVTNTVSLTVSPATLTVTANNRAKTYGQTATFAGTEFATAGLVNGDTVTSVSLASSGAAATATVASSPYNIMPGAAVGTGLANYTISYANGSLTVNPASLTITANNRTKTYGQTVTFAGTEFTPSGLLNSDTVTSATLTSSGAAATATVASSPYNIVPGAAAGTGLANYTISYVNGSLTVNSAALTITANNRTKIYGQTVTFAGTEFTPSGLLNSDTVTSVTLTSSGAAATATVTGSPYNILPSVAVGTGLANYTITYLNGSLTVNSVALTITANNRTKTYGQTVTFAGTEFTPSGLLNSDTVTSVTLTSSGAAATATVTGSPYNILPSVAVGTGLGNYTISYASGTLTVVVAAPVLTWTNPISILYGGALNSIQLNASANVAGGYAYTPPPGTVLNTGTNALSVLFTPTDAVDYSSVGAQVSLVVAPAPLSVTAASFSRPFGTANPVLTGTIIGLTNGDNITAAYTCGATSNSPVGSYPIVPSLVDPADRQTNYAVTLAGGLLVVGHPAQVLTWANPAPITYGAPLSSVQLNAAVNVPGSYAYAPTNGAVLNTGTNTLSVTFTPTDTVDYSSVSANVSVVVTPAPLTVRAANTNRAYGQANPVLTGTIIGLTNGDTITAAYSCGATAASPVGSYSIVPGAAVGTDLTNYAITYANGSLTVSPASLTITANTRAKTYGQPVTFAGTEFTTGGLANSDTVTSATLTSTGAAGTATVAGSPYNIVPGAAAGTGLANYTITYANGSLTVTPASLTITANTRAKTYGQSITFAGTEFTAVGLLNSDTVTSATLTSAGAPATATVTGSPYAIVPATAVGTGLNNYTISYANGSLTVNPANLTVTANARAKTYGQSVTFAGTEFTASGLLNSDTVTSATLTSAGAPATATVTSSPYNIVPGATAGTGLANYTISYANGSLTVNPANLTVTANSRAKTYGQTVTFAGTEFTTAGLLNSDTVTSATLTSAGAPATATVTSSPYNIVPGAAVGTGLNNYTISYANGSLTVNPANLTVTANTRAKTYGQPITFAGTEFTTSGLLNSDTVTSATLTSAGAPATATVASSPYNIVPSAAAGTGLNNYAISYANGTLTVNPANLTITANTRAKTYGQSITFAGTEFTASGLLNSDTVTSATLNSAGAPATATVIGSPYAIVPSAAAGAGLANYTISYVNGSLTVAPASLTVTANSRAKTYGQSVTFAGTEFTASGLFNSDTVTSATLNSAGAAATATVAGSPYAIVPSAAAGTGLANYTISYDNGTLTVSPAALTVTANSRAKTYGQAVTFAGTEFAAGGLANGDAVTSVTLTSAGAAATATVASSPYNIVPSAAAGTGLANYTISYDNGLLTVNPAGLTITANSRAKTYGQSITFAGTEFTASGLLNSDTVTSATLTSAGAAATATVASSPYNIVPGAAVGTGLANYTISYADGTLTVSPAGLTVTANARAKTYGQSVTFAGTEFAASGLLNSDTVTSATLTSAGAAATATVAGSPYNIVPGAAVGTGLANYTITYANGSLTVTRAGLTVTANSRAKTYGQSITFAGTEFTTSGLLNSDTVTSATLNSAGAAATATVAGSPYAIVPSAPVGTGLNNYTIAYANGSLTVNQAALTVTANSRSKTYGQTVTFAGTEFTTGGLLNGDTVTSATLTSAGAAATATVVGSPYNIVPGTAVGTGLGNYTITYDNGSLTVSPANLTVTANSRSKTYGQTVTFAGTEFAAGGLVNGDSVTSVSLTSAGAAATATVAGSPYNIVPGAAVGTGLANYTITYDNGTLTVSPAVLTVTANNRSKTYGQTAALPGAAFASSGLVNSDTVTSVTLASAGAAATATVAGSPYNIVPSAAVGTGLANYTISYDSGSLTVTPAALSITANSRTKTYGQTVTFAGTEFAAGGLLNSDTVTSVTLASAGAAATATVAGSPYSIVPSAALGTGLANYTLSYLDGTLTVVEATLTVTWANPASITYGAALTSSQLNATATVPGSYAYTPASGAVLNTGANTLSVVFTPTDTADYSSVGANVSLAVTPAPLSVTAASLSRPFGAANPVLTGTIIGLTNGDNITANYSTTAAAGSPLGGYAIAPSLVDPGHRQTNYTVSLVSGTLTVVVAAPVLTWTNPISILYGGALNSIQLNASANVAGGYAYTPPPGTVLNTGTNALSVLFTPTDAVDYSSVGAQVSLVVAPAPLSVTAASFSRPFGTANPVLTGTIIGLTNGDNITAAYTCGATSNSPVGSYPIVPSLVDPADRQTNYAVTLAGGLLVVGHPAQVLTWANPAPITYGAPLSSVQLNAAVNVPGSYAYAPTNGAVLNTGTNTLSVTFTPTDTVDYSSVSANVSVVVTPAPLTVRAANTNRAYGQANPVLTGTIIGLTNGDTITAAYSCGATAASPVGSYSIVPGAAVGTDLTNYAITYANGSLTVSPASLTITANTRAKTYGQPVTFAGTEFTTGGLANSDTVTSATLTSTGAAGTATVAGSPYNIVPGAAAGTGLANYTITYANGSLTVTPASLTITANTRAKTYGQSITFAGTEFTAVGLLNSDTVTSATLTSAGAPATATVTGSPYAIVPATAVGTGLNNYTISYANGSLTVNPANLTVTANARAKTYGQSVTFAGTEFTASGLLNSDTVTSATLTSAGAPATATVTSSPYNIVPGATAGTGLANYTISYANGSLTVNPANLTVTANSRAKTYGQTVTFAGTEFTTAGLLNSDTVTSATLTSAGAPATATVTSSPYNIVPGAAVGTGLNNYTISYANGSLTVNPANLTVTANTRAKTYGQPITFAGTEFTTSGLLNSDTVTSATLTSAGAPATATVASSPYNIVPSAAAGTGLNNYAISYANGTLTVNPANLTITANTRAKTYGQSITFAGTEFTASGLLNSDTVTSATLNSAGAPATATVIGSPYAIVPSAAAGAGLANYTISYVNGSLSINPATLTVTAGNQIKTYGQAVIFAGTEFTTEGLVNGDTVTSVTLASAGAAATATVAGSPYNIVPSAAVGTGLANYTISYINGLLTVNPAPLTVTPDNRTKTYGQTATFAGTEFAITGVVDGDTMTTVTSVTLTSTGAEATAPVPGSPYKIVSSAAVGTGLANYTMVYTNGWLTVSPAALTITANNLTKAFGQTVTFAGTEFTTAGLVNGDTVSSVTLASSGAVATATVPGSPYTIVPSAAVGTGLANYTITYVNGILTVTANTQPIIESAKQSGNLFTFTWSATATQTYQIQSTTNLSQNIWANLGNPVVATNSTGTGTDSITNLQMFYRVVVMP